jgi:hypothetical protein
MKLRGKIVFEVEAHNLSNAAEHEKFFLECVERLAARFGNVESEFREFKSRNSSPRMRKVVPKTLREVSK